MLIKHFVFILIQENRLWIILSGGGGEDLNSGFFSAWFRFMFNSDETSRSKSVDIGLIDS